MAWSIVLSDEISTWYAALSASGRAVTDRVFSRLAEQGNQLRMPHSRPLGTGLYELRFTCENKARRVTYIIDPDRQIVTLTTFHKQRQNERGEILRARRAQAAHQKGQLQ